MLTALRVRGLVVPDAARERILADQNLARLERRLERAVISTTIEDALDEPS